MEQIIEIDTWLFLTINSWFHEVVDPFMRAFSGRGVWVLMYVSMAAVLWWKYGWRRALVMVMAVGAAVGLSNFVCDSCIRPFVQRLRPSNLDNPISEMVHIVDGYRSGAYGFPSCHGTNTVSLAVITSLLMRQRAYTIFIWIWAIAQCYSRVYLGVHYPGDLAVGALIGAAISYAVYQLLTKYVSLDDANAKAKATPVIITGIALIGYLIVKCALA